MTSNKAEQAFEIFQKGYNQQVIFYGPPGTSKTYTSNILAGNTLQMRWEENRWHYNKETQLTTAPEARDYLEGEGKDRFALVQFHPSYTYEDFIRGIKVDTKEQLVTYEVVNKVFGLIAEKAKNDKEHRPYVLVIDEINRAPLASVLGELIYGLEYRDASFSTPYTLQESNSNQLVVPSNLFIIGTMNTADRSIGSMDYAVRRRFAFLPLPSQRKVIETSWQDRPLQGEVLQLYDAVCQLFQQDKIADISIDSEDIKLGHTYFLCDEDKCKNEQEAITHDSAKQYMTYRLDYQIKPILREYVKDGLLNLTPNEINLLSI